MITDEDASTIIQALIDPAIFVDGRRKVVFANSPAIECFGEFEPGTDLALSLRHPEALDAIAEVLAGANFADALISHSVPIHQVFEMHVSAVQHDSGADDSRALCVLHDVTSAKDAERIRADFVANVSHELRSPLVSLIGFIETLMGPARNDAEAQMRFLGIMDGEAKRMARIVNDLLSLSRVEAGEHLAPAGSVDIHRLLEDIARTVAKRAEKKGMSIDLRFEPGLPKIPGDGDELVEVFENLIDNAVKYGLANTSIIVSSYTNIRIPDIGGQGISVMVENQGDFIEPEHLPRLTERFYRVEKGRSRGMGGTGLGLAIVKHIVNHHRGRLTINSDKETGNTFTVFLPIEAKQITS